MAVGFEVSNYLQDQHSQGDAERDDRNADAIDDAKKPSDWKLNYALRDEEPGFAWALDRRLTPAEAAKLKSLADDKKAVWAFVREQHGWRSGMEAGSYKLQLTSEKSKPVAITRMRARAVYYPQTTA
ncbi:hypothetical protein ABT127_30295 [Streptomyces sp. NPDC001904]|uniref:hypothetical protein n=1 Tax=Streptomyces sp. NPDC001904 TaxID=3154531 RepID=UPI003321EF97